MNSESTTSWGHSVGAALLSIVVFFALLYVAAPIVEWLMNIFGRIFVPARYGGGSEVDHPGLWTLAVRAVVASGLSAVGGLTAGTRLFPAAKTMAVAIAFSVAIVAWSGLFFYVGVAAGELYAPVVLALVGAAPALVVAYWFARDEL